jgi:hypothetical protein
VLTFKKSISKRLNAELNPIRHLLALAGARHFVHVSRIRVNPLIAELNPIHHLLALTGARHFVDVSRIRVKSCQFIVLFFLHVRKVHTCSKGHYRFVSQNFENLPLASLCLPLCLSVLQAAWNNSSPTASIFMKFDILRIFQNYVEEIQVLLKSDTNNSTLQEYLYTFMIIHRSNIIIVRNISAARSRETQNTHFIFDNFFSSLK